MNCDGLLQFSDFCKSQFICTHFVYARILEWFSGHRCCKNYIANELICISCQYCHDDRGIKLFCEWIQLAGYFGSWIQWTSGGESLL